MSVPSTSIVPPGTCSIHGSFVGPFCPSCLILDELRAQAVEPEGEFRAWDTMAVELEVAELLHALVRQAKPDVVVEAGSGNGYASTFIAAALNLNGRGHLYTYEQDPEFAERAASRLAELPATVINEWSSVHPDHTPPELVFIDSLGGAMGRDDDIHYWLTLHAGDGFVVVVHDANGIPELPAAGVRLSAGRGVWIGQA